LQEAGGHTVLAPGFTDTPVLAKFGFNPQTMKPMNADQCVAEGLRALQENRSMIIPGKMNRLMNAVIPASFKRNMTAKMFAKVLANSRSTVCRSC
jgi:short-subunit dehydrogenase